MNIIMRAILDLQSTPSITTIFMQFTAEINNSDS